jgi:hypothetical protein
MLFNVIILGIRLALGSEVPDRWVSDQQQTEKKYTNVRDAPHHCSLLLFAGKPNTQATFRTVLESSAFAAPGGTINSCFGMRSGQYWRDSEE